MSRLVDVPLDFLQDGSPKDEKLYQKAQEFCEAEFGAAYAFEGNLKSWVTVEVENEEKYEVIGVTSARGQVDICLFHVKKPTHLADRQELRKAMQVAEQVRDRMVTRLVHWVQDNYGRGTPVFVHIDPLAERFWRKFLRFIKAEPANRVIVKS